MAARAMWKGQLVMGDVEVPVKLYSAIEGGHDVHFRLLHEKDLHPVKQEMVNPATGRVVPYEKIQRAYQTESGDLILLSNEELDELQPKASRDIEITRFVDPDAITHEWYDRPYYLGPDGSDAAYFALVSALKRKKKEGVARWVMRKKEYVGALLVEGDYLMLITLRHAGEVVPATALSAPGGRAIEPREITMARQLVAALEDDLDLTQFRDEYRDRVLELVEARAEGKVIRFPKVEKKAAEGSLAEMLARSVRATKKRRVRG